MMILRKKMNRILVVVLVLLALQHPILFAEDVTPTPTPTSTPGNSQQMSDLQNQIDELQKKVSDLQGQSRTLSSQIGVFDNQIKLTQLRINATQQEILQVNEDINTTSKRIDGLQESIDQLTKVLLNRIKVTYEVGSVQPLHILLYSDNASDFVERANYLRIAQQHDKQLIYETQQAKNDYANQKQIFEDRKKKIEALKIQLEDYTKQMDSQKQAKQKLLAETQGSEAIYQRQLSAARAQLASLAGFSSSRFGSGSIIAHSDMSDSWGKYYNQRDEAWGKNLIGYSPETITSVGCLLTSYAMVVTHFGGSATPASVAADGGNFSVGTAYFNKPGPSANGHSVESRDNPSLQELRDALNSGAVVIAGLSKDGGPYPSHYSDHWVVLRSVDGNTFRINDPLYAGAMNVSLNDNYSGWSIIESRIYR